MEQNPLIIGGVHHPDSVVINVFYFKTGAWAGAEQLLTKRAVFHVTYLQTSSGISLFCLSSRCQPPPLPVFIKELHAEPEYVNLFKEPRNRFPTCIAWRNRLSRGSDCMAKFAAATSDDFTYGLLLNNNKNNNQSPLSTNQTAGSISLAKHTNIIRDITII